eukprot:4864418-Amphidinium_carterae.2
MMWSRSLAPTTLALVAYCSNARRVDISIRPSTRTPPRRGRLVVKTFAYVHTLNVRETTAPRESATREQPSYFDYAKQNVQGTETKTDLDNATKGSRRNSIPA